jgi:hypothetical protein
LGAQLDADSVPHAGAGVLLFQTMTASAGAAWPSLIKKLKTLVDGPQDYDSNSPAFKAAFAQFEAMKARPMTRATSKRVILESKVREWACWMQSTL